MIVRVVSRGGAVKLCPLVEITQDRKVVVRWPNGAGLWDFMLAHGCQCQRPASEWKWRICDEDLAELQEAAREAGVKFVREMPAPNHARKSRAPRVRAENPKQVSLFRGGDV